MDRNAPVGVFDSGLGGLSVLAEIRRLLPHESLLYVADSAYVPYGEKTTEEIIERSLLLSGFLLDQRAKALVVACNTATAAAIQQLRERWPGLNVIGMEPAVKPAAAQSHSGKIGVLATTGTLRSAKFAALLERYSSQVQVLTRPCPGLVERIEAGELDSPATRELLAGYVQPLLAAGCDSLILGCTHYPFIRPLLRELVGPDIAIIDTGAAVARRLQTLLAADDLLGDAAMPDDHFYTTGELAAMQRALPVLWSGEATVQALHL
ncbi:MAG: glutamate racemase [Gammaproteobacteria bacterium]|nr:glutamate racemase [Gammaproteobacteria bacterium]